MAIDIKQQARQLMEELYGAGKLELLDQLVDDNFVGFDPLVGRYDRAGFPEQVRGYRTAFPDLKLEIVEIVAEGNIAAYRWKASGTHQGPLGEVQPTGKRVEITGLSISEFRGGKLLRDQTEYDALGMFRQLGVEGAAQQVPAPAESAGAEARH